MDEDILERLAPDTAPTAWLAIIGPGSEDYVIEVGSCADEFNVPALEEKWAVWVSNGERIVVKKDSPSLSARFRGGLYSCGYDAATPAHLSARKNWILRYRDILAPHLRNATEAMVHFFGERRASDPFSTMRSSRVGPFPFPAGKEWPVCPHCSERMSFVGTLDFRSYPTFGSVRGVPNGSLVLHFCEDCLIPAVQWLICGSDVSILGGNDLEGSLTQVGEPYPTIEFSTPGFEPKDLSDDAGFNQEWGIDQNFACPLTKIGGRCFWIQGDQTPSDRNDTPMKFIGQFIGSKDVGLSDGGIVSVFFSEDTGETKIVFQFF